MYCEVSLLALPWCNLHCEMVWSWATFHHLAILTGFSLIWAQTGILEHSRWEVKFRGCWKLFGWRTWDNSKTSVIGSTPHDPKIGYMQLQPIWLVRFGCWIAEAWVTFWFAINRKPIGAKGIFVSLCPPDSPETRDEGENVL